MMNWYAFVVVVAFDANAVDTTAVSVSYGNVAQMRAIDSHAILDSKKEKHFKISNNRIK